MSIFLIMLAALVVPLFVALGVTICMNDYELDRKFKYIVPILILTWIVCILIGIGINTDCEIAYVSKYEAQKDTIEQSLKSDILTGLERIELVTKATELNGELAEKKARYNMWHYVYYDNSIYDNVGYIKLHAEVQQ